MQIVIQHNDSWWEKVHCSSKVGLVFFYWLCARSLEKQTFRQGALHINTHRSLWLHVFINSCVHSQDRGKAFCPLNFDSELFTGSFAKHVCTLLSVKTPSILQIGYVIYHPHEDYLL